METAQLLGTLIVNEVAKLPPLSALALFFETGQEGPALYLAYETVRHAQSRFQEYGDIQVAETQKRYDHLMEEGAQPTIARLASDLTALSYLRSSSIGKYCNGLLETGYWDNPASPVLFGVDPNIDRWAVDAFAALSGETEEKWKLTHGHLTGTLWAALDHARRASITWPPIAFVASFDDNGGDLPFAIISRHQTER